MSELPMYSVLDVSDWTVVREEPGGSEEKYWLVGPTSDVAWLFKPNNVHPGPDGEWTQREDLAEKGGCGGGEASRHSLRSH